MLTQASESNPFREKPGMGGQEITPYSMLAK